MLPNYAKHKEFNKIKAALRRGDKVNSKDSEGYTALIYACGMSWGIKPSLEIAKYLIDHGAKVNAKAKRGITPLTEACTYGNYEIVKLLIDNGADTNSTGEYGISALMSGATCSHWSKDALKIVKILIDNGANFNAVKKGNNNALLEVLSNNDYNEKVAKQLIDRGTDLEHVGSYDATALTTAAGKGYLNLVKYLVENSADINAMGKSGESALVSAFRSDHKEVVLYLLKKGANHKDKSMFGNDLISYAGEFGYMDILDFLEKMGVIFAKSDSTKEALIAAAMNGRLNIIKYFKQNGVDLNMDFGGNENPSSVDIRQLLYDPI